MKKLLSIIIVGLFFSSAFAAVPAVNKYIIEKRPIAPELTPDQYSISEHDQSKVVKPPFRFYTQFNPQKSTELYSIPPYDDAEALPKIGKWMVAVETKTKDTYVPSHWLDDLSAKGQYIIEPINYLFVVYKDNETAAINALKDAVKVAGYNDKWSGPQYHSDNYHAYIGDTRVAQLKRADGIFLTFSDNFWKNQNDHFRIMGAYQTTINGKKAFLFASSVSEESVWSDNPYAGHFYVSFGHARDNLATALIKNGFPTFYVIADNVLNTAHESTMDHDGKIFVTVIN